MDKALIVIISAAIVLVIGAFVYAIRYAYFKEDFKCLTMEIKRSEGREREYWRRKRRHLLLSYMFFLP